MIKNLTKYNPKAFKNKNQTHNQMNHKIAVTFMQIVYMYKLKTDQYLTFLKISRYTNSNFTMIRDA